MARSKSKANSTTPPARKGSVSQTRRSQSNQPARKCQPDQEIQSNQPARKDPRTEGPQNTSEQAKARTQEPQEQPDPRPPHSSKAQGSLLSQWLLQITLSTGKTQVQSSHPQQCPKRAAKRKPRSNRRSSLEAQAAKAAMKAPAAPVTLSPLGGSPPKSPPRAEATKETQEWSKQDTVSGVKPSLNNKPSNANLSLPSNLSETVSPTVPPKPTVVRILSPSGARAGAQRLQPLLASVDPLGPNKETPRRTQVPTQNHPPEAPPQLQQWD